MATSSTELDRERSVSPAPLPIPVLELASDEEETSPHVSPVLVGTLVANFKRFLTKTIGEVLSRVWSLTKPVEIKEVKDNVFTFHFSSMAEKKQILLGSHWNFSGHLLCLKECSSTVSLSSIGFDEVSIWVQIHSLTPNQMILKKAKKIGGFFVAVETIELPLDNSPHWDKFYRMRVKVNLKEALPIGFLHKLPGDEAYWVQFQYENIGDYCAKVGHVEKDCPTLSDDRQRRKVQKDQISGILDIKATKRRNKRHLLKHSGSGEECSRAGETRGPQRQRVHLHISQQAP
ncbi:hypothetical protein Tsubulata_027449 [Turnera subulata]|uniref:DUF4283 domain-containing protein n=1 Tax=Turnera subulata TaxID=218843 RepID=A0A9Q0FNU8_9ROSI|nr:hypothetical protein Tsubulata_027449 [Turnera subulata]